MGAGSYPAGTGPAGFDPVLAPTDRTSPSDIVPLFDPYERGYPYAPNGEELIHVHPVMQSVAIALGVPIDGIPSAGEVGINIKRIRNTPSDQIQLVFEDEVRNALAHLTRAGHVLIKSITATASSGAVAAEVVVVNLRDPSAGPTTFPVRA